MLGIVKRLTLLGWILVAIPALAADSAGDSKTFVYIPDTVSPEARKFMETLADPADRPAAPAADDVAGWKQLWQASEELQEPLVQATLNRYEPTIQQRTIGGVPVLEVNPKGWKDNRKLLVYTHGGAYTKFSAHSLLRSAVLAADTTGLRVISVDYTVAPAGLWQKVTDEVLAVIQGLVAEGYKLNDIGIYGDSAGGGLAAGAVLRMRDKGLGMPGAVVLWSPWADITDTGDSAVTLKAAEPTYLYEKHLKTSADAYADPTDQKQPYVSPVYGDYSKGFPPTLIQGGTKEIFLSHFVRLYRAIDGAGGVAVLDLYEGMPHVFQNRPGMADAPEGKTALGKMKSFLDAHLGK